MSDTKWLFQSAIPAAAVMLAVIVVSVWFSNLLLERVDQLAVQSDPVPAVKDSDLDAFVNEFKGMEEDFKRFDALANEVAVSVAPNAFDESVRALQARVIGLEQGLPPIADTVCRSLQKMTQSKLEGGELSKLHGEWADVAEYCGDRWDMTPVHSAVSYSWDRHDGLGPRARKGLCEFTVAVLKRWPGKFREESIEILRNQNARNHCPEMLSAVKFKHD